MHPGYQQQMQPQYYGAASAGMSAEEKKEIKRKREEELRQREFDAGRKKRDLTRKKDANNLIYGLCLSCFIVIVMLTVAVLGDGWFYHRLMGFGVTSLTMTTSLFEININVKCGLKSGPEEFICERLSKSAMGEFSLHEAQNHVCALAPPVCPILKQVYMCSFILFGSFFMTAVLQIFGSLILYNYWFINPLPKLKRIGIVTIGFSFLLLLGGLVAWTCMVPDISIIPKLINAATATFGALAGEILSLRPGGFCPYGWCWFMVIGICAMILLQIVVVSLAFKAHEGEQDALDAEFAEYDRLLDAKGNLEEFRATGMDVNAGMMQPMNLGPPGAPMMQMQPGMLVQPGMPLQPGMEMQQGMPMQHYPGPSQGGYPMQPAMNYGATPQF